MALLTVALVYAWTYGGAVLAPLAIGLAVFVIAGALADAAVELRSDSSAMAIEKIELCTEKVERG